MMADERDNHFKTQPLRVGFYDIEKTIGKGNFAVVKLGRHRITKSQVTIQIVTVKPSYNCISRNFRDASLFETT